MKNFWTLTQKGVSLIELLIFIGIFSVVVLVLTDIFVTGVDIKLDSAATSSIEQDGRFILSRMRYDISRATSVISPAGSGDSSGSLTLIINGNTHTYNLNEGILELTNTQGTNRLNGNLTSIDFIEFRKVGNPSGVDTVRVEFTVTSLTERKKGAESQTFQTTFGRR